MVKACDIVAKLFGVGSRDETDGSSAKHQSAWLEKRKRLLNRRCGPLAKDHDVPNSGPEARQQQLQSKNGRQKSRQKRNLNIDNDNQIPMANVGELDDNRSPAFAINVVNASPPLHAPLTRTFSDTAILNTTAKSQKHLDDDNLSNASHDITDFDARESIVKLVNDVLSRHQPRRAFGMGLVGNLLSRKFRKDLTHAQMNAIYSFNDHRPYFTYWVTTVQILIMIITLLTYGFGPFGLSTTFIKDLVLVPTLVRHYEGYYEKDNAWLGPRAKDLIHLGAKFTPCMRKDSLIYEEIRKDHESESSTGCCIRAYDSTCLQTTKRNCNPSSEWHNWNETTINSAPYLAGTKKRRTSGPVCGQDPQYCLRPASQPPHEWPDDITKWPICEERQSATKPSHMSCGVVGRPCCIGIYGQCRITTSQYCQFLGGTFHPSATLCSQVSCLEDVCGMIPFYARDYPDQFYRLFTALFLHAGLIHLFLTVVLQYYIMRDLERLLGSTRMAIIYILSGVAGYLASATFVPYHTQVGPSGSQFALLACLIAETINGWKLLEDPMSSLWKLILIALGLFILGLLPWIDNYAHIFGFLVGFMLSMALTPYLTPFNDAYSRRKKVIQSYVCIMLVILTFVLLPLPLYIFPLYKCSWCRYLDCWPLTPDWCENQDIKVTRLDIF